MKTTTSTKTNFLTSVLLIAFVFFMNTSLKSQCNANFTFTLGANGNVNFTNASTNTSSLTTFQWNFGNNTFSYTPNVSHTFPSNGLKFVCLTIYDTLNNCLSTHCDSMMITNSTNTTVPCNAHFTHTVTSNGNVNFTSTSTGTTALTNYSWYFGNNIFGSGQNTSTTFALNSLNWVCLTISDSLNNCTSTFCDSVIVGNFTACVPQANFTMIKDTTQLLTWDSYVYYSPNIVSAVWNWGDNSSTNSLYPSHTYSAAGLYSICVTASASCGGTVTFCYNANIFRSNQNNSMIRVNVLNASPTGIKTNSIDKINDLILFPNPAKDKTYLTLNVKSESDYKISITEITGKVVYTKEQKLETGNTKLELDTDFLNKGFYFVTITDGTNNKTVRLIKD